MENMNTMISESAPQ